MPHHNPETAAEFVRFMEYVWNESPLAFYDEYEDAIASAKRFGARRTGGSFINGEPAHVYRFPADNGHLAVRILHFGHGIELTSVRYGPKQKRQGSLNL
jgi:hypothetical protein